MTTHDAKDAITHIERTTTTATKNNKDVDTAARWLADVHVGDAAFTHEEEQAVLRRIDFRVLPLLLGAYFFQQLDKSSLSYVSIFGITKDAGLVGKQYSWLGSILYLAQLVMQPLAAFLLVKLPTGKVIAGAIFCWGSSLAIMAACTSFKSLLGLRFLLGSFEAMIAPACVATTTMWWRRSEQTMRTASWNAMNGVTFIVGSLFTYGLGHIDSDAMYKYQIIFLFCGLLTVSYAFVVLVFMPDSPMKAKHLSERERVIAVERLRANQMGIQSGKWKWDQVWETFIDLKTWCWFIAIVAISIASGGISSFGSLIVKDFGYTNFEAILFNIPFGAIQIVSILGSSWGAARFKRKGLAIALVSILPAVGTVLMLTVPRKHKGVLLFGYYLVSCLAAVTPLYYTWHVQNTAGDTKKKCTSAMVFVGMCTGNVIGPLLYSVDDAPEYRPGLIANLVMFVLTGVLSLLIPMYLALLNKRHAKRREELGKSALRLDESMLKKSQRDVAKGIELEGGGVQRQEQDNGFSDKTDMTNEDFIYGIKATILSLPAHVLTDLFIFANAFDMPLLRNAALDAFFHRIYVQTGSLPLELIPYIYQHTGEGSSLRHLAFDVVIATESEDKVAGISKSLSDDYYEDRIRADQDGFEKASDVPAWLEKRKVKICKYYHLHEEEDDRLHHDEESSDDEETEYLRGNKPGQIPAFAPTQHTRTRY